MIMKKETHQSELYDKLTQTKAELHELVKEFGIVHELTVAKSQELDLVINEYMIKIPARENNHNSLN